MRRSSWTTMSLLLAAVAVGCGEGEATSLGEGGSAGGGATMTAGGSGGTTTSVTPPVTTSVTVSSSSSGGTGGGASADCPEGSLYALSDADLNEDVVSMCKYKGDVLLIVNTAQA